MLGERRFFSVIFSNYTIFGGKWQYLLFVARENITKIRLKSA